MNRKSGQIEPDRYIDFRILTRKYIFYSNIVLITRFFVSKVGMGEERWRKLPSMIKLIFVNSVLLNLRYFKEERRVYLSQKSFLFQCVCVCEHTHMHEIIYMREREREIRSLSGG